MKYLEQFLNKFIVPVAEFMNGSQFFSTLSEAFMRLTAITLGGAVILLIGNFPIPAWLTFLETSGIAAHIAAAQNATMNALALFVAFNFAYVYTKKSKLEPLSASLIAVAAFLILMPQTYSIVDPAKTATEVTGLTAFGTMYTGATGIIVAILIAWLTSYLYVFLNRKNIVVKLPASVPPNVSESLRPSILAGIILIVVVLIRMIFEYVPVLNHYENIFNFIGALVQVPLQGMVSSPISLIIIAVFTNLLWFFGIHPNMVYGVTVPLLMANAVANQNAFLEGAELPYLMATVISYVVGNAFGGQGQTLGLVIAMSRAKSERYKELFKLSSIPSIFNINEPLIFGMPIMMNPIFFLPMMFVPIITGVGALLLVKLLFFTELNPMIMLPWTTPGIFASLLSGGWKYAVIALVTLLLSVVVWYPFFMIADKKAVEVEKQG